MLAMFVDLEQLALQANLLHRRTRLYDLRLYSNDPISMCDGLVYCAVISTYL